MLLDIIFFTTLVRKSFRCDMIFGQRHNGLFNEVIVNDYTRNTVTCLVKLARFCMTLAVIMRQRLILSSGYSSVRLNKLGDMIAGQKNRRNIDPLRSFLLTSLLSEFSHLRRIRENSSRRSGELSKKGRIRSSQYQR
jgi:hypothetical protein